MASLHDFPARGRISEVRGDSVVFKPAKTTYELILKTDAPYAGPLNTLVSAILHVTARKLYSVPSGGNFITPIVGPPRIVQGRVRFIEAGQIVVQAGTNFVVQVPVAKSAIDLNSGAISVGSLVNAVALPGATIEIVESVANAHF